MAPPIRQSARPLGSLPRFVGGLVLLPLLLAALAPAAAAASPPVLSLALRFDPGDLDLGQDVAVDGKGNFFLTGTAATAQGKDFVTAKFSPDGTRQWLSIINLGEDDRGEAVAVDKEGNAYAAGAFSTLVGDNMLLVKFLPDGTEAWRTTFDKGTSEAARGIDIAPDGNVYVTGVSLSRNGGDGFVAKFAPDGREIWSRPVNLWYHEETFDVAATPDGGAVVAGRVLTDKHFDVLVRAFGSDGSVKWTQFLSTSFREEARGVSVDPSGNVYVAGTTTRRAADGENLTTDWLVAKWDASGALLWQETIDLAGDEDEGRDVLADPWGGLLVTGFGRILDDKQAVTLRLNAEGEEIWRATWGEEGIDGTGAIAATADGSRILAAGATQRHGAEFDYLLLAYDEQPPRVAFTARPGDGGRVAFEDATTPGRGLIASRLWDFGDGTTAIEQNPIHTYTFGGTYTVTLTVLDDLGNGARRTQTITVDGPPRPSADVPLVPGPAPTTTTPLAPAPPPESGSSGIPGFEPLLAVGALVAALLVLARRARRE